MAEGGVQGKGDASRQKSRYEGLDKGAQALQRNTAGFMSLKHRPQTQRERIRWGRQQAGCTALQSDSSTWKST